jgi:hypothetical protein
MRSNGKSRMAKVWLSIRFRPLWEGHDLIDSDDIGFGHPVTSTQPHKATSSSNPAR